MRKFPIDLTEPIPIRGHHLLSIESLIYSKVRKRKEVIQEYIKQGYAKKRDDLFLKILLNTENLLVENPELKFKVVHGAPDFICLNCVFYDGPKDFWEKTTPLGKGDISFYSVMNRYCVKAKEANANGSDDSDIAHFLFNLNISKFYKASEIRARMIRRGRE